MEGLAVSRSRSTLLLTRTAWFVCGTMMCGLAACSGNSGMAPTPTQHITATPTATPTTVEAASAATTVPLVAGNSIPVPSVSGFNAEVSYSTSVGTPFPTTATVTLQTLVGEPPGGPAPQSRIGRALARFDATPSAIFSILATYNSTATLNTNFLVSLPSTNPSAAYGAETFDESTGQLVANSNETPLSCPTGGCGSNPPLQFFSGTAPYSVKPGVGYLTIIVANAMVSPPPTPMPLPICTATPPPQVTPSPQSSTAGAPQTATVCDDGITFQPIGSFSGTATYFAGAFGSIPSGEAVTLQAFLGEPADGPAPQFHRSGQHRLDSERQAVASLRSTFSENASLTDNFRVFLPGAESANTYTAETYDETSGQLLYFVRGGLDPNGYGDYLFASPGTSYSVAAGAPILTLFVANSAVSPAP